MQGITSLEGHGEANSRMRNSLRMVVPQLSPEQKEKIMQDIMQTVSPQPEPAMPDNINIGDQQFDMSQLDQMPMEMPMQAAEDLADMGQGGDTKLAHMDPETIAMAQAMGILPKAKQNVMTGLPAFEGDNPGQDDPNEGGGSGSGAGAGDPNASGGPADADLGATPAEVAAMNDRSNSMSYSDFAGVTGVSTHPNRGVPMGVSTPQQVDNLAKAKKGLSKGYQISYDQSGLSYVDKINEIMGTKTKEEKEKAIDATMNARLSVDPTQSQLDLNNLTDFGFRAENPGTAALTGGLATIAGFISPALAAVNAVSSIHDTSRGYGLANSLMGTTAKGRPPGLEGLIDNAASIMDQAATTGPDAVMGREMDRAGGGIVDFMDFEPKPVEEGPVVDPVEGVNSGLNMLISEGYAEDVGQTIIDNFRTVEAFKQSYRNRFNQEPTPVSLAEPSKREFINIGRGQVQGMT